MTNLRNWSFLVLAIALLLSAGLGGSVAARAEEPKPEKPAPKKDADEKSKSGDEGKTDEKDDEDEKEDEPDRWLAIEGGTVHTVTGGVMHGATVLCKNGKIFSLGRGVRVPEEAERVDAAGLHVYPGLVAAGTSGLIRGGKDGGDTDVFDLEMAVALAGGITTVESGGSAYKLTFGHTDEILLKKDLFVSLNYDTQQPAGRHELRQKVEKVRQYLRDLEAYEREKKDDEDAEEPDKDFLKGEYEEILKLLRGETKWRVSAQRASALVGLADFARQYNLPVVVDGALEGWTVAPHMSRANFEAVITPRVQVPRNPELNRKNGSSIENARILYDHGIPLAITPRITTVTLWGVAGQDLLHLNMEAAFAVRGGLPSDAALRAITIDAAKILGVDHRVGSIEVGKDADFVIADGDLLHYMTLSRYTIVNGRIAYDKMKDTLFDHIRPGGDRDAPPPDDYWPRKLGDPMRRSAATEVGEPQPEPTSAKPEEK